MPNQWTVIALLLSGCASSSEETSPPDAAVVVVDAPSTPDAEAALQDPGAGGPYKAGVKTIQLTDASRNRKLPVDIWYPVVDTSGTQNTYKLETLLGTLASIDSPARRNATPAAGAWPVIVFSHGFGGVRFQSYFLTERLATHGFVVIAMDHPGNTLGDFAQLGDEQAQAQSAIDRPLDILFIIDRLPTLNVPIDATRIGATGHSFGGWAALEAARRDSRIDIVFPMAPGFRNGATDDFVALLARPLLLIGGSLDDTCEFPANQLAPFMKAQTPKYLLEVMNAGHLDFSNLCEVPIAQQLVDDGCDPTKIDPVVVHARTNRVATAFALRYLLSDPRYDAFLADPAVMALGNVMYWSAK
jgi:predicted dienelactone hydrolase